MDESPWHPKQVVMAHQETPCQLPYQWVTEESSHLATLTGFKEAHEDKWNAPVLRAFSPAISDRLSHVEITLL